MQKNCGGNLCCYYAVELCKMGNKLKNVMLQVNTDKSKWKQLFVYLTLGISFPVCLNDKSLYQRKITAIYMLQEYFYSWALVQTCRTAPSCQEDPSLKLAN